jgi:hypothetical protein
MSSAAGRVLEKQTAHLNAEYSSAATCAATSAELDRVAVHEASHVVLGTVLGLRVASACIRSDGTGAAVYEGISGTPDETLMVILCDLAGVGYELLLGADERRLFHLSHCHDVLSARLKLDELRTVAPELCPSTETLARFSISLVTQKLETIFRIARVLRAVGELNGEEIFSLCRATH